MSISLEYLLTHGAECVQRLNEAESYVESTRREFIRLQRDLRDSEASLQTLQRERNDERAHAALREKELQGQLAFAQRSWWQRLRNSG